MRPKSSLRIAFVSASLRGVMAEAERCASSGFFGAVSAADVTGFERDDHPIIGCPRGKPVHEASFAEVIV